MHTHIHDIFYLYFTLGGQKIEAPCTLWLNEADKMLEMSPRAQSTAWKHNMNSNDHLYEIVLTIKNQTTLALPRLHSPLTAWNIINIVIIRCGFENTR